MTTRDPPGAVPLVAASDDIVTRKRSNSQSQVISAPQFLNRRTNAEQTSRSTLVPPKDRPQKRHQTEYYVTLVPLNDTFITKHIHVPYFPETCKLGRPTGTKVKPHVSNGYFDSRVLSRNHACMFINPKSGKLMVQDMGSSNGTFVNSEKISSEPVQVNVGDTINLGFNIQVETNHKQISARIESINVVSNNPDATVSKGLPGLTNQVILSFSEADSSHFEFMQNLLARISGPNPSTESLTSGDGAEETEDHAEAMRFFDRAMFSDIVPSLKEMFDTSAYPDNDAGIYSNSDIINSTELRTTLDYLNVCLAKIKQQNSALSSLGTFFENYSSNVEELNSKYLNETMRQHAQKLEKKQREEANISSQIIQEKENKITTQARIMSSLELEVARLKSESQSLAARISAYESASGENITDNDFDFQEPGQVTASDDHNDKSPQPEALSSTSENCGMPSGNGSLTSHGSSHSTNGVLEKTSEVHTTEGQKNAVFDILKSSGIQSSKGIAPYIGPLNHALSQYKNQGVVIGFAVVVAGFIYQNTK